ncbi:MULTISPECIES: hypothetical protein [unclassified Streptomyces]|uniref:hypothetical protein n=1 Tax=unclassified Streptomyces TaxID=2593676 RepID=UPI002DD98C20|nr:hypothetical protein [Streptomyces sp. NBC_00243]WRZ23974.1 hypothetical protein OHT59_38465 [Streptomyces sp. NBC_00243]
MNDRSGDTYNVSNYWVPTPESALLRTPTTPRRVAKDQLVRLQRQFARPTGMNAAYDVLETKHTVFLYGEPGSGRSSAARVLLSELPPRKGTYHELTPEKPEGGTGWLPFDLIGESDRMLLDLTSEDEPTWSAVHDELSGFRHELLLRSAFLAVVLPYRFEERLSVQFSQFRRAIGRPDAMEILTRHLRLGDVDEDVRGIAPPALHTYLGTRPSMRELARLADRIVAASNADGFVARCEAALAAQTDRGLAVAEMVPRLRKGRQRALLLTTAMLHGARAEAVNRATTLLVDEAGSAHDDRPLLEHKGLTPRLETVRAVLDVDSRVRFAQPGFAESTRRYFWIDLPDVRAPLSTWLDKVLKLRQLDETDRERVVRRFTDLCLSTSDTQELETLVRRWTRDTAHRTTEVQAAAHLLKHGVESEKFGGKFRAMIYEWSTGRPTNHLREVLVEVCEKVMSIHHPESALVRLHHLARHEPHPGVARAALQRYVNQDSRLQRRLLARLATAQASRHHRADAELFLAFSEFPDDFFLRSSTRGWLTTCWRMAFELVAANRWTDCAQTWLITADAVEDRNLADAAADILVDASDARYSVLSRIYADARRTVSPEMSARLMQSINKAQRAHFSQRFAELGVSPS